MSKNTNKELERAVNKLLVGLEETRQNEKKKQNKRFWSEIHLPFTLQDGLSKYTKYELDDIRKRFDIKKASSLKKAELISLLVEKSPALLQAFCLLLDDERFNLLIKMARNNGYITAPNFEIGQIKYFRSSGLVYTGVFQGEKVLAIPEELIEPICSLADDIRLRAAIRRNTDWINLTRGLLYYYGTLRTLQLEQMLRSYTKEPIDLFTYFKVINDANEFHEEVYSDVDGFSNMDVIDSKRVLQEHQLRSSIDFYPFTKNQLLNAGEPGFVERNKSYMKLVRFLTQNFDMNQDEADSIVEECVYWTKIGNSLGEVIQHLADILKFNSEESVRELTDHLVELMNNTREWDLKGYTSTELAQKEKQFLQPFPSTNTKHKAEVKVGRNAPCPCGSNKKYKKCCGR